MQRYPPELRNVLSLDPTLLGNQSYLAPYPVLASFLNEHPEIGRNPSFYFGPAFNPEDIAGHLAAFRIGRWKP